ncbi:hypothetical protein [Pseudorhodoferax sp. Leaf274]|uniref:hypothetical protein n=1 Tax=Pseudorhodoferax sp. Leaf274 TaxID=1736318 RepID=UPI0012E0DCDB|nr:hypothetical protein [Pseudorhodoferax sp. Leaf274]
MTPAQIREGVDKLQAKTVNGEEEAWAVLKPLGIEVVPYLLEAFPRFRRWQARTSLMYHAIRYARRSNEAFQLGLLGTKDKSTLVRYRACGLLAYSLRKDALTSLQQLLTHSDQRTVQDAVAAIDAIERQNHHLFIDRNHSGQSLWVVSDEDGDA